jgi:hypothetical protein
MSTGPWYLPFCHSHQKERTNYLKLNLTHITCVRLVCETQTGPTEEPKTKLKLVRRNADLMRNPSMFDPPLSTGESIASFTCPAVVSHRISCCCVCCDCIFHVSEYTYYTSARYPDVSTHAASTSINYPAVSDPNDSALHGWAIEYAKIR